MTTTYDALIQEVCDDTPPVPFDVLKAMVAVESNFNPKARSTSDARGLCQLIPKWHATGVGAQVAKALGKPLTDDLWYDPEFSLRAGALHLRWCFTSDGSRSWERAVRKYHSGSADPPAGFVDGQGTSSDAHIAKFKIALTAVRAELGDKPTEDLPMPTHRFILSPGHRNTDGGGAPREIDWTYPMCRKVAAAIERRGGEAWIITEEDGDKDPSFAIGRGLQAAARLCVSLAQVVGGVDAYLSLHYEGTGSSNGPRGCFGIHADGWWGSVNDTKAVNPLDVKLCENVASAVATTGIPARKMGAHDKPGVMSERESNVGSQGGRLGEFVGTLGFRDSTARMIFEFGNYSRLEDRNLLWSTAWQDEAAEAFVDGLEKTFGAFGGARPTPKPTPVAIAEGDTVKVTERLNVRQGWGLKHPVVKTLDPGTLLTITADDVGAITHSHDGYTWLNVRGTFGSGWAAADWVEKVTAPAPVPTYDAPLDLPEIDKYMDIDAGTIPATVSLSGGYLAIWVGDGVRTTRETDRLRDLEPSDKRTGAKLPAKEPFNVDWLIVKPGSAAFEPVYRTPWRTIIRVKDTERVSEIKAA